MASKWGSLKVRKFLETALKASSQQFSVLVPTPAQPKSIQVSAPVQQQAFQVAVPVQQQPLQVAAPTPIEIEQLISMELETQLLDLSD